MWGNRVDDAICPVFIPSFSVPEQIKYREGLITINDEYHHRFNTVHQSASCPSSHARISFLLLLNYPFARDGSFVSNRLEENIYQELASF